MSTLTPPRPQHLLTTAFPPVGADVEELLRALSPTTFVLNAPPAAGGGDIDCAVEDLDPSWPLRTDWRLVQVFEHDVTARCYVLERDGTTVAVDVLCDPKGLGRERFPTGLTSEVTPDAARAAYLTAKRIRKSAGAAEWRHVRALAARAPEEYEHALSVMFGGRDGRALAREVLSGATPTRAPRRPASHAVRRASREVLRRLRRTFAPNGMTIVVAGPDGTGKSTLVPALEEALRPMFRGVKRVHFRPGVLPRAGALAGRAPRDASDPHGGETRSAPASLVLLLYFFVDFFVGGWLAQLPFRVRNGLVVVERGWLDLAVDARRYRLHPFPKLVRALSRLLPQPDLTLALEAPANIVVARKSELAPEEIERQSALWRRLASETLDATADPQRVTADAREHVVSHLERRAIRRHTPGWSTFDGVGAPRLTLPRGARPARAGLGAYQPITVRASLGWRIAQACAGGTSLARRDAPPVAIRRAVAPYLAERETFAVCDSTHPGRSTALVVGANGTPRLVVKVALDERGREALAAEARALTHVAGQLDRPVLLPTLVDADDGVLVVAAERWRPRRAAWRLDGDVAHALGRFAADAGRWRAHGDFAPWNLLAVDGGWVLIDWERYRDDAPPFYDLAHYLARTSLHLGRPPFDRLERALDGDGWVGRAVTAFATGAGVDRAVCRDTVAALLADPHELLGSLPESTR